MGTQWNRGVVEEEISLLEVRMCSWFISVYYVYCELRFAHGLLVHVHGKGKSQSVHNMRYSGSTVTTARSCLKSSSWADIWVLAFLCLGTARVPEHTMWMFRDFRPAWAQRDRLLIQGSLQPQHQYRSLLLKLQQKSRVYRWIFIFCIIFKVSAGNSCSQVGVFSSGMCCSHSGMIIL